MAKSEGYQLKQVKVLSAYIILGIGSIIFLFPLLWMVVTSFKVSGTGDKFIFLPTPKVSFRYAEIEVFEQSGIFLEEAQFQKLENLRNHL